MLFAVLEINYLNLLSAAANEMSDSVERRGFYHEANSAEI